MVKADKVCAVNGAALSIIEEMQISENKDYQYFHCGFVACGDGCCQHFGGQRFGYFPRGFQFGE